MTKLDIVIPARNEAPTIGDCLRLVMDKLADASFDWRVILVDNDSTDGTAETATVAIGASDRFCLVREDRPGKGAALVAGFRASKAEYILYMDADLSADLKHINEFFEQIQNTGSDMIIGSRLIDPSRVNRSFLRTATSRLFNFAVRLALKTRVRDTQCGFKMMKMSAIRPILEKIRETGWFFDTELILLAERRGLRISELPIRWEEQIFRGRRSKLNMLLDSVKTLVMLVRLKQRWG
jgi:glycosyltransferase involved in cell wall biosynthesis